MTREEITKVVKEIREHCSNNNCRSCEAQGLHGCVFMSGYPNEWCYIPEVDEVENEEDDDSYDEPGWIDDDCGFDPYMGCFSDDC